LYQYVVVVMVRARHPALTREEVRDGVRPKVRGDCLTADELGNEPAWRDSHPGLTPMDGVNAQRPCPWSECRYHLTHATESCALDVADQGGHTTGEVSAFMGVSRQRVEYLERRAIEKARRGGLRRG
jgi:hypothetical protein